MTLSRRHRSIPDHVAAFVEAGEQHAVEVTGPDPVVDLLQANVVLLQGLGDEQQPPFETNCAGVGDPLDEKLPGVLERGQVLGIGPERGKETALMGNTGSDRVGDRPTDSRSRMGRRPLGASRGTSAPMTNHSSYPGSPLRGSRYFWSHPMGALPGQ